jgi:hypothetical protein
LLDRRLDVFFLFVNVRYDCLVVAEILFDLCELSLSVVASLLEQIEVLGIHECGVELLHGVLERTLFLAVEAPVLQVVNRHQYACQVAHLRQLLGGDLFCLGFQLVFLVLNRLETLLELCDVVIELHDLRFHVFFVVCHRLLKLFQLSLQLLHALIKLSVRLL